MAQINIPRLPAAQDEYSKEQISQMIQTLDQLILLLNSSYMTTVTSTGDAVIYTVPSATTTIVKTAWAYNDSGGSAAITLKINTTALSTNATVLDKATESFFYLASGDIGVMEAGDILKINNNAQPVNVYLAILEIS